MSKRREQAILSALSDLGGEATTNAIWQRMVENSSHWKGKAFYHPGGGLLRPRAAGDALAFTPFVEPGEYRSTPPPKAFVSLPLPATPGVPPPWCGTDCALPRISTTLSLPRTSRTMDLWTGLPADFLSPPGALPGFPFRLPPRKPGCNAAADIGIARSRSPTIPLQDFAGATKVGLHPVTATGTCPDICAAAGPTLPHFRVLRHVMLKLPLRQLRNRYPSVLGRIAPARNAQNSLVGLPLGQALIANNS